MAERLVVHLPEVRFVSEPPGPRQRPAVRPNQRGAVLVVEEPRSLPPAFEAFLEFDGVRRAGAGQPHQFRGGRLARVLGMEEHRGHGLLDLPPGGERRQLLLGLPRDPQFLLEELLPRTLGAEFGVGDGREFGERIRSALGVRVAEQDRGAGNRALVPAGRLAEADGERSEDPPGALESRELGPPAIEDLGEVGMERVGGEEAFLLGLLGPPGRLVQLAEGPDRGDDVRAVAVPTPEVLLDEEAAPQHLPHVLLRYRLDPFLPLPAEHVEEVGLERLAGRIALRLRVGGEQRGHQSAPIRLDHRLHEGLEKVLDPAAPAGIEPGLLAGEHEDLVHEDEARESLRLRTPEQFGQERLRRGSVALLRAALGVEGAQPVVAGELVRQHAPRMPERAALPRRSLDALDPLLDINLVEAERDDPRPRQRAPHGLPELLDGAQVRKRGGIPEEVVERDQGVSLPAAVGQLELAHRLVARSRQPVRHVPDQPAQRVGGEGQREELRRILVHRARTGGERHLVEIGGELGQGQLAALQLVAQPDDLPPRGGSGGVRHGGVSAESRPGVGGPSAIKVGQRYAPVRRGRKGYAGRTPRRAPIPCPAPSHASISLRSCRDIAAIMPRYRVVHASIGPRTCPDPAGSRPNRESRTRCAFRTETGRVGGFGAGIRPKQPAWDRGFAERRRTRCVRAEREIERSGLRDRGRRRDHAPISAGSCPDPIMSRSDHAPIPRIGTLPTSRPLQMRPA